MPTWQPNWEDVTYNYGEAREAIAACHRALSLLAERGFALAQPRANALEQWEGGKRVDFDAAWDALERRAQTVGDELRATIDRVQGEIDAADLDQRGRESERDRWRDENHREQAAALAAAESQPV